MWTNGEKCDNMVNLSSLWFLNNSILPKLEENLWHLWLSYGTFLTLFIKTASERWLIAGSNKVLACIIGFFFFMVVCVKQSSFMMKMLVMTVSPFKNLNYTCLSFCSLVQQSFHSFINNFSNSDFLLMKPSLSLIYA